MSKKEEAVNNFKIGFSCSQSVLSVYAQEFGLTKDQANKIACGFGSGLSRTNQLCGAVTGAIMVIGLKYGKTDPDDSVQRELTFKVVNEFNQRFKALNCSLMCSELLGVDLKLPEAHEHFEKNNLGEKVCQKAIYNAVEILEKLFREN